MSFYHKYRPQKFSDLYGQDHVKKTLTNALQKGSVGHAYLFSGPRGVGKTTVARLLAKALNCENSSGDFEPCNSCQSCSDITKDKSLDVIEIDAASNRGIDEIRELREKIRFAPTNAKHKIYIIDEVHMLTKEAFNALLKTLEEPPKHAVFVMATTELHKIPATILSRVQQFDFRRARVDDIEEYLKKIALLEKIDIDDKAMRLVSISGQGSYRDATSILDQIASISGRITLANVQETIGLAEEKTVIDFINFIAEKNCQNTLLIINELFMEGYDLLEFNKNIIEYLRKMLIYKANTELLKNAELTDEQKKSIMEISKKFTKNDLLALINMFIEAGNNIKNSNLPQLPLEMVVMEYVDDQHSVISFQPSANTQQPKANSEKQIANSEQQTANSERPIANQETENINREVKFLDDISLKASWPKVLSEIGEHNRSLYFILKESEPMRIENGRLVLGIKFQLYQERITNKKNYNELNRAIENAYGQKYPLDFLVDENILPSKIVDNNQSETEKIENPKGVLKDALELFG
jgi:DNA polymerase-3 subunit gamma/tau